MAEYRPSSIPSLPGDFWFSRRISIDGLSIGRQEMTRNKSTPLTFYRHFKKKQEDKKRRIDSSWPRRASLRHPLPFDGSSKRRVRHFVLARQLGTVTVMIMMMMIIIASYCPVSRHTIKPRDQKIRIGGDNIQPHTRFNGMSSTTTLPLCLTRRARLDRTQLASATLKQKDQIRKKTKKTIGSSRWSSQCRFTI